MSTCEYRAILEFLGRMDYQGSFGTKRTNTSGGEQAENRKSMWGYTITSIPNEVALVRRFTEVTYSGRLRRQIPKGLIDLGQEDMRKRCSTKDSPF